MSRIQQAYRSLTSPREALRSGLRLACVGLLASTLAGCSFAIPSLTAPDPAETTGSITPAGPARAHFLFAELGPEETRRARGALALALDPQGNGRPVKWDNPESGMRGDVAAGGPPFVEANEICRSFTASLQTLRTTKQVTGQACRISPDEWVLRKVGRKAHS